jgi:hypothetical protein
MPMRSPEGEKGLLAGAVRACDPVEINIDFSGGTALGDGARQTICPFPDKLPAQDNLDATSQVENRHPQHTWVKACSVPRRAVE